MLGFGAAGRVAADSGDLPPRQQRHAVPDGLQRRCGEDPRRSRSAFVDRGYAPSEVWGLGYQGDQCDLAAVADEPVRRPLTRRAANVDDLRALRARPCSRTPARSASTSSATASAGRSPASGCAAMTRTQPRAPPRHDRLAAPRHHRLLAVAVELLRAGRARWVQSEQCDLPSSYGAADTPFLTRLNRGEETPGPTKYLALRNADADFVYISAQDGPFFPAVPARGPERQRRTTSRSSPALRASGRRTSP